MLAPKLKRRGNILVVRAAIVTLGTAAVALRQNMKIFPKSAFRVLRSIYIYILSAIETTL